MAENIKVVMEADASQMVREFRKAQNSAKEFGAKALPLTTQELNRVHHQAASTGRQLQALGRSARGTGQGMLQLTYFMDDLQYGFRGVGNNIPGLLMGLGASAGLAGVISLVALATAKLVPLLKKLYTDTDIAKIKEIGEAVADRYQQELEGLRKVQREKEIQGQVGRELQGQIAYGKDELRIQSQRLRLLEAQGEEMGRQRAFQDELGGARTALALAGVTGDDVESVKARAEIRRGAAEQARQQEIARLEADVQMARERGTAASEEAARIENERDNLRRVNGANLSAAEERAATLARQLAAAESQVVGAEKEIEEGRPGGLSNRMFSTRARDRIAGELGLEKERIKQLREAGELQEAQAAAAIAAMNTTATAAAKELKTLQEMIRRREKIHDIVRQIERVEEANAVAAARKREADAAERQLAKHDREEKAEWEKQLGTFDARHEFKEELMVLQLRAAGDNAHADALEKEQSVRRQGIALAKRLNVEEWEGIELARERQRLLDAGQKGGRRGSRIGGDTPGGGLRIGGLQSSGGLRRSAEASFALSRSMPLQTAEVDAKTFYTRSLADNETIISIFKKLGAF